MELSSEMNRIYASRSELSKLCGTFSEVRGTVQSFGVCPQGGTICLKNVLIRKMLIDHAWIVFTGKFKSHVIKPGDLICFTSVVRQYTRTNKTKSYGFYRASKIEVNTANAWAHYLKD